MAGRHGIHLRVGFVDRRRRERQRVVLHIKPAVGTHADAPLHVREGWSGSHELSLDAFYGPAIVVDVSSLTKEIEIEDLEKIQSLPFVERLLLRTAVRSRAVHSRRTGRRSPKTVFARCSGADSACSASTRRLWIRGKARISPCTTCFFAGNAAILENLDLRRVTPTMYELMAFPLKLMALDAAPVRAVLREIVG